MKRLSIEK